MHEQASIDATPTPLEAPLEALVRLAGRARPALALTGAGVSTDSGIPDYRDTRGDWKRAQPIQYREFVERPQARQRYWARSLVGWPSFARAEPGPAHRAIARLEASGVVHRVVTQNVDGLHGRAGSEDVVDLHGSLAEVACLACGDRVARAEHQRRLAALNPGWSHRASAMAPDGDVDLEGVDYGAFRVPGCAGCGGVLKPTVVFFGESVPRERVAHVRELLASSGMLLCVGTSLMVFSGYRFVREARALGIPVALVNVGRTRADDEADLKVDARCAPVLEALAERLAPQVGEDGGRRDPEG